MIKLGKNSPLTFIENTIKNLFKRSSNGEKSTKKLKGGYYERMEP
jgi:hypothetical protein